MVILLALHFVQVVIDGAYRAPREINFWLGLILMQILLAMALTGYLLPWDQKGYWATKVATNMIASCRGWARLQRWSSAATTTVITAHAVLRPACRRAAGASWCSSRHIALFRPTGWPGAMPAPDKTFEQVATVPAWP
jgi:quinol-cytochrome oxidoreductase complex cytochrome b subunit